MFFCFFKQKTAYEMRISDWSSDVCSSDLFLALGGGFLRRILNGELKSCDDHVAALDMKDGLHLDLAIEAVFGCAQRLLGIAREQGADVLQIIFDRRNLAGPYQARHRLILSLPKRTRRNKIGREHV